LSTSVATSGFEMGAKLAKQVLVVGAGPVGLTMAAELARYGVSVRIVDKSAQRTDKSKAIVLWSRTLELLDRAGCSGSFVSQGLKVDAANILAGDKLIGHVSFAGVNSPHPYALGIPQSDTERLLEEHLGRLGVRVERQVEVVSFKTGDKGVEAVLRHVDGSSETVETDWLIGCDGAHSAVRHGLGLSFEGDTLKSDWILADVHMKGYPFPATEMATYWHQSGVLLIFPITAGRYRIIADLGTPEGQTPEDPTLDRVQAIVSQRGPGGLDLFDPIWLSAFRINERKVTDYRSGRVFVVGDAAHVHSPAGGQGMNTGMQDAFNLAWKLAMVCKNTCSEALLDSYSVERSAVGTEVLKAAGRLTAVAVMRNPAAQSVRNLVGRFMLGLNPVRNMLVEQMTETSIGYAESPLNGHSVHRLAPEPGQRMPPLNESKPVGSGDKPLFSLFAEPGDATTSLLRDHAAILDQALLTPPDRRGIWLVRPDGYVACVSKDGDAGPIADYLENFA
jgi:2-polyprenyl-6-methoxyphenol hydroxylase-like FAD-dependent oxidoreductase